jgi:hypothetical protein
MLRDIILECDQICFTRNMMYKICTKMFIYIIQQKNWFLEQSEIYEVSKSLYCLQVLGHHFLFIICKGFIVVDFVRDES